MADSREPKASRHEQALGPRSVEDLRALGFRPGFAMRRVPSVAAVGQVGMAPPAEPVISPPRTPVPVPGLADADAEGPRGPDYDELLPIIDAAIGLNKKRRARWRKNLELPDGMKAEQKEALLNGEGRVKVASPETREGYLSRGKGLFARFKWETGSRVSLEDIDPREFVNWLLGLNPALRRGTWRTYRASVIAIIQSIPSDHMDEALAMLHEDLQVGDDDGRPTSVSKEREATASLGAKRMQHQHFLRLKLSLRGMSPSRVVDALSDWLDAGINTGLRPMEWTFTALEKRPDPRCRHGQRIWLHVISARAPGGPGTYRTLEISNFSLETLGAVERMVERSRDCVLTGRSATLQGEVAKLFRKTCKALFPRMQVQYTLYSLRHQFIANMKTIYTREQVAAMTGYSSVDAQVQHYTKRRSSWSTEEISDVPVPVEEQVARIKRRLELSDLRRRVTR
jgi:hypothetical protein